MSVPHTGRLVAEIDGQQYTFDGDRWAGPAAAITELLNATTDQSPKHHYTIQELARNVFFASGIRGRARILQWRADQWPDELPPDAID